MVMTITSMQTAGITPNNCNPVNQYWSFVCIWVGDEGRSII